MTQIVTELTAVRIYLATIGSVYPIAPERAIGTIDQAIAELEDAQARIDTALTILGFIQVGTTDDNARAAATWAIDALREVAP